MKTKLSIKGKPTLLNSNGKKMMSVLAVKQAVEQKRESARVQGEQKPTNGSKYKVPPETKLEPKVNKEVQAEKDDKKDITAHVTTAKFEEVGPSAGIKKRQPEKLPLAHYSPYVVQLMTLDDKLSEDEVFISEYLFSNVEDVIKGNIYNQSLYDK